MWVGQFDVSSIITATGVLPHYVFGQAVTDIVGGVESYVDGYGPGVGSVGRRRHGATGSTTSLLTVTGFLEGNTTTTGDILAFDPQDWATLAHIDMAATDRQWLGGRVTGATIVTHQGSGRPLEKMTYVGTSAWTSADIIIAADNADRGRNRRAIKTRRSWSKR